MKKTLLALLFAGTTFAAFTASADKTKDLIIGTEATYAPFEFINDKNEIVGFDIDVINKICADIQVTCKIVNQNFDGLIPSLKTRRIDAAIAGIDVTAERKKQIDFTQVYYDDSSIQYVTLKGGAKDLAALNGKRIGVLNGSTYRKYLAEKQPTMTAVNYDSYQYAVLDLKAKRIDAILSSSLVTGEWLEKDSSIAPIGDKIVDRDYFGEGLGIALRKGNSALLKQFNQSLDKLKASGELDAMAKKWFNQ